MKRDLKNLRRRFKLKPMHTRLAAGGAVLMLALVAVQFIPLSYAAGTVAWDFTEVGNYSIPEPDEITLSDGEVSLTQLNQEIVSSADEDFSSGNYNNTRYANS